MIDKREQQKPEDTRAVEQDGSYKNSDKNAHHHINHEREMDDEKNSIEYPERSESRQQNVTPGKSPGNS